MKVVGKEFAVVCRLPAPASGLDYRELEGKPVRYRDMVIGEVDEVLEQDGEVCARLLIWNLTIGTTITDTAIIDVSCG